MHSLQARAEAIASLYQPPATGRPSDIGDVSLVQQLLEALAEGNYLETSCYLVGLSKASVYNWLKRGETGEQPFASFMDAVKAAEARAEAKMVANVRRASDLPQFWAAAATHLERRHPDRWGKRQDDTQAPRVVVQIGVGQGEVKVGLVSPPTFAPDSSSAESLIAKDLGGYAELSSPITAVMVPKVEACQPALEAVSDRQIPAVGFAGGPNPHPASAGGQRSRFTGKGGTVSRKKKASRVGKAPEQA